MEIKYGGLSWRGDQYANISVDIEVLNNLKDMVEDWVVDYARVKNFEGIDEAIKARADAQADANKTIAASLSPTLIQYQTIERWNGVLPKVASSANPLISLDLDDENTKTETQQTTPSTSQTTPSSSAQKTEKQS